MTWTPLAHLLQVYEWIIMAILYSKACNDHLGSHVVQVANQEWGECSFICQCSSNEYQKSHSTSQLMKRSQLESSAEGERGLLRHTGWETFHINHPWRREKMPSAPFSLPLSLSFILGLWILSLSFCLNLCHYCLHLFSIFVNWETIIHYILTSMLNTQTFFSYFVHVIPAPWTLMCS